MNMKTTEERVIQTIAEQLGVSNDQVKPETKLEDELGADSLDRVELCMALEDEFGWEDGVPDEDSDNMVTVQNVIDYTKKRQGETA